jgi:putative phosphoesterase
MPQLVKRSATLPEGATRLAVVADTHSEPHREASALLRAAKPQAILHAGDIGDLGVLEQLSEIAPVFAIRGNIDTRARDLPDVLTLELGSLRIFLVHIGVYGPHLRADVARMAVAERASLVVCGHSHVPFIGKERGIAIFNPGSIGPRRFHLPIVFGTINVTDQGLRMAHVDCETGRPWLPPG